MSLRQTVNYLESIIETVIPKCQQVETMARLLGSDSAGQLTEKGKDIVADIMNAARDIKNKLTEL